MVLHSFVWNKNFQHDDLFVKIWKHHNWFSSPHILITFKIKLIHNQIGLRKKYSMALGAKEVFQKN